MFNTLSVLKHFNHIWKNLKKQIHSEYFSKKIRDLDFGENSFDAVIMLEVAEHLEEQEVFEVLRKLEKWAREKVIISTPNGFFLKR